MRIVDSQVHIWAAATPERPWPARHAAHREVPLSAEDLLKDMDAAGVHGAILVPPSWEGERNDLVLEAAARYPDRFAAMGRLDPDDPDTPARLAGWRQQPGMLGLRFSLHRPGMAEALGQGSMDAIWHSAERHGVPIMLLLPQSQMPQIARVAERYPGLRLVMDHLGAPSSVPIAQRFDDLDELLKLAAFPNVAVKASALPCLSTQAYPHRDLHEPLRRTVDAFGPRRVFWGSDLSRLPCDYRSSITMLTESLPWLSKEDQSWVMGKGLCAWVGWDRAPATPEKKLEMS